MDRKGKYSNNWAKTSFRLIWGAGFLGAFLVLAPAAYAGTLQVNGSTGTVDVPAGGTANVTWDFSENAPATGVNLRIHNGPMGPCSAPPPYSDFSNPDSGYSPGTIGGRTLTLTDPRYVVGQVYHVKVCAWQLGGSPDNLGPESNTVQIRYGMGGPGGGSGIDLDRLRKLIEKSRLWVEIKLVKLPKPWPPCLTCPPILDKIRDLDARSDALVKEGEGLHLKIKEGKVSKGMAPKLNERLAEIAKQLGENAEKRKNLLNQYSAEVKKASEQQKLAPSGIQKQMGPPAKLK